MKTKGFTLIELVIVLAVLSCIVSTSVLSYKFIKNIQDDENIALSIRVFDDTITFARLYCLRNNKQGRIILDQETGNYYFYQITDGYSHAIRREKLDGNMHFLSCSECAGWQIDINAIGEPMPGTVVLVDNSQNNYTLTIGVGDSNEEVYN